jgi:hypothetical protein
MWTLTSHFSVVLLLFSLCEPLPGKAQGVPPSEMFIPLANDNQSQTNPEQSKQLQHIRDLPTTQSVHVFRRNQAAPVGDELKILIPNDKTLILSRTGGEVHDPKDFTWFGVVRGEQRGSATLIARNGELTGSISTPAAVYRISSLGEGLYAIVKVDTQKLPPEEPPRKDPKKP